MKNTTTTTLVDGSRFGPFGRYKLVMVETRFGTVQWFVMDAENIDELTGFPAVIRQCDTIDRATMGLLSE